MEKSNLNILNTTPKCSIPDVIKSIKNYRYPKLVFAHQVIKTSCLFLSYAAMHIRAAFDFLAVPMLKENT